MEKITKEGHGARSAVGAHLRHRRLLAVALLMLHSDLHLRCRVIHWPVPRLGREATAGSAVEYATAA